MASRRSFRRWGCPATGSAVQRLGRHGLAARDFLELFVRALHAKTAHHRLDGLGQHFPRRVQVLGQGFFVDFELVQAGEQRGD